MERTKHSDDVMRRLQQMQASREPRASMIEGWLNGDPDETLRREGTGDSDLQLPAEAAIVLITKQEILLDRFQDLYLQEERRKEIRDILEPFELLAVIYGRNQEMTAVLEILPPDIQLLWKQLRSCMERLNQGKFNIQISVCTRANAPEVYRQMRREAKKVLECRQIVADARKYVYAHFDDSRLDLPEAAEAVGSNPSYLSRIMKQELGMSFKDFVTNLRITHAIHLMHTTDLSINQIADRVGYSNQHYFSAAFKNVQGISPSDYRRGGGQ